MFLHTQMFIVIPRKSNQSWPGSALDEVLSTSIIDAVRAHRGETLKARHQIDGTDRASVKLLQISSHVQASRSLIRVNISLTRTQKPTRQVDVK